MGKQHTTTKIITAGVIGAAGFVLAGPLQASAKTVTVQSGDTVWRLAHKYGVSVSSIEKTNHLQRDTIFAGQQIVLGSSVTKTAVKQAPVKQTATKSTVTKSTTTVKPTAAKQTTIRKAPVTTKAGVARHVATSKTTASASTYKVKSGDTLNKVSARYGMTASQLKAINHLTTNVIYAGQKLTIRGTAVPAKKSTAATVKKTPAKQQTVNAVTKKAIVTKTPKTTKTATAKTTAVNAPKAKKTVKADAAGASTSVTSYAVKLASEKIPYTWGGSSLRGMDCSGFTSYVYAHTTGTTLPHNTVAQESHVSAHSVSSATPGDLLFWGSKGATYHVGIYIGNNQFVAAPEPGENVQIQSISPYFKPSFAGTVND
ncbi:LysM peptidoglycan-binding domain-containing protein [Secundilactobacillus hailunensis]|uniref:LysM peptidoglycan-binding domain-containing protein n=1 Tax=Secundilactobacillus hailunensis TaxID=2559923 RepID=A0ABW1TBT1_9LACO|nr:C40 family peptidase [Secundilactobacillus hailunensis]